MSDLDILRALLKKEALVAIEDGCYGKKMIKLHEPKCDDNDSYIVENSTNTR